MLRIMRSSSNASSRRAVVMVLAAIGLGAAGLALFFAVRGSAASSASATADVSRSDRYEFDYRAEQTLVLPVGKGGDLATSLTVRGHLTVSEAASGRRFLFLEDAQVVDATLGAERLSGVEQIFSAACGQVVTAHFDGSGRFMSLDIPEQVPEAAQGLFQHLAATLQRPPVARAGHGIDATSLGLVDAVYAVESGGWRRTRGAFTEPRVAFAEPGLTVTTAEGGTRFELDDRGTLAGLQHDERVRGTDAAGRVVVNDHVVFRLRRQAGAVSAPAPAGSMRKVGVGEVAPDRDAARAFLRQATGGLTAESLATTLRTFAGAAELPDHAGFLYRAAALLRLEPDAARVLAAVFAEVPPGAPGRALILDLLAQVNTDVAQETMVAILESPEARSDAAYPLHLQRTGFAADPGPALVGFVSKIAETPAPGLETPARFALGALAGNVARSDADHAARLAQPLVNALVAAKDSNTQAELLRALGNAGLPSHLDVVRPYVDDHASIVRRAAAAALRKVDTSASRGLLVALVGDEDPDVALEAVRDLGGATLDESIWGALGDIAGRSSLDIQLAEALVNLAALYPDVVAARALLDRLAARPDLSPGLAARLRILRG